MSTNRARKPVLTDAHKAALDQGRREGRIVRNYLDSLRAQRPRRGRPRTRESIEARLAAIESAIPTAGSLAELKLVQERIDLTAELDNMMKSSPSVDLVEDFVKVAKSYSQRQGISYDAWRGVGVVAAVLKRAGISRSV